MIPALILASWEAALACSSQARLEQSSDRVLPVPVGDSSRPFLVSGSPQNSRIKNHSKTLETVATLFVPVHHYWGHYKYKFRRNWHAF